MPHFLCKLLPPRPTFAHDMSSAERAVMWAHVAYWSELSSRGVAAAFGPVMDPDGAWGLGILETEQEAQARTLAADDPVSRSGLGFRYDIFPLPGLSIRPFQAR